MELRDAIRFAIDHLTSGEPPDALSPRLSDAGYSKARASGLASNCTKACELARDEAELDLTGLQNRLIEGGTRADQAALIAVEVFSDRSPELRLGEREGVPVLQLLGDLDQLPSERLARIRAELLEPLYARDARLLLDVGGLNEAPLEVFGELLADVATLRAAGGELALCGLDEDSRELAESYRLGDFLRLDESPEDALARLAALPQAPADGKRFVVLRGEAEGVGILALRGALDARSVERAQRKVSKVVAQSGRVILDCREVPWIDAAGFEFLRATHAELTPKKLALARLRGPGAVAAGRSGLAQDVPVHEGRTEALEALLRADAASA